MKENQNAEIETEKVEFEKLYKKDPNPSADELNNQRILDLLIKMKKYEYKKAIRKPQRFKRK